MLIAGSSYPRMPRHVSVDLTRPHNLYGLPERVVATESLLFLVGPRQSRVMLIFDSRMYFQSCGHAF